MIYNYLKKYKNIILFFICQLILIISLSIYNINIYVYFFLVLISFSAILISNSILFEELNTIILVKKQKSDFNLLELNRKNYEISNKITVLERSVLRKLYHDYNKHKRVITSEVNNEDEFSQQQEYKNKINKIYSDLLDENYNFCKEERFNTLFHYFDFLINVSDKKVNIIIESFEIPEDNLYDTFTEFYDEFEKIQNSHFIGNIIINNQKIIKVATV
jgi:hypothetical protein